MAYATIQKGNVVFIGVAEGQFDAELKVNELALKHMNYDEIINPIKSGDNIHPRFSLSWKKD